MDSLLATWAALFATTLALGDTAHASARATLRAFGDSVAAESGSVVAFCDNGLAFHDKPCVKVGRERHLKCQRCRFAGEGPHRAGWRMGKKSAKCYKNGHARRGWRHLRHAKEQKRPAQGEQRNKQGEARCAMGTCGMGVGWRLRSMGLWRWVSARSKTSRGKRNRWTGAAASSICVCGPFVASGARPTYH